jgi:hypothetical protein
VISFPTPRPNLVEFLAELGVIVDFAVERNPEAPIRIRHRLVGLRREVYNREAAVSQADVQDGIDPKSSAIRPPVNHLIAQAGEIRLRNPKVATLKSQDSDYSTHEFTLPLEITVSDRLEIEDFLV